jgi:hypothetical protein
MMLPNSAGKTIIGPSITLLESQLRVFVPSWPPDQ